MSRVGCAILAAGGSRRLGLPKQLVLWRGRELVRHAVLQGLRSNADEVAVIVGAHAERVVPVVGDLPLSCIVNLGWREGIASSIRCATHWAAQKDLHALILMVSDQPHLDAHHLDRLIAMHEAGFMKVASRYSGVVGVPALFPATAFRRLFGLSGDAGAAAILRDDPGTLSIEWPAGEVDIDTTRDLALLLDEPEKPARQVPRLRHFERRRVHGDPITTEDRA
jgi:CTP:molybdopterin cytidylyltransferase MocA